MDIFNFIAAHWIDFVAIVIAALAFGHSVAKVTPTDIDDKIIDGVESTLVQVGILKRNPDGSVSR